MTISASAVTALRSRGTTPTGSPMATSEWQALCTCLCPARTWFSPSWSSAWTSQHKEGVQGKGCTTLGH
jgi:hypothetical protein